MMMMKIVVKPSVRDNRIFSLGPLFRLRFSFMVVAPLSVLLLVLSAGRGHAFSNGVPGTKLGAMVKGSIATTAALSATTSKTITGALLKIPQGNAAVSAVLSAGTLLFAADQVEAGMTCISTNYPNYYCANVKVEGCSQGNNGESNNDCCTGTQACDKSDNADIGCCSCNGDEPCMHSPNAVFYDNVCNGQGSCYGSANSRVYSGSCNAEWSCSDSPYLTVGSGACNQEYSCTYCCGGVTNFKGVNCPSNTFIPNGECNSPGNVYNTYHYPSCEWCPQCLNTDGTSCYHTQAIGQATLSDAGITEITTRTLSDAGITDRRAQEAKKSKQKHKTSKKTPMSCESAKDKIVSYFQEQSIPKLRSKYTSGKVAKSSKQGGERKRSRDCHVELSWLYEHLEEDELVQACAELEAHATKLQAYLGKSWTIKNFKCIPEDKNKIH